MRIRIKRSLVTVVLVLAWGLFSTSACAADAYYMIVFAYQGKLNLPKQSHTFATFIKVPEDDAGQPDLGRLESHTISWVAATPKIILLRPRPEPGVNLDLAATLQLAASQKAEISAWGPYRIQKDVYDRALAQIDHLNSGKVQYKALDGTLRPIVATNCIHAISDMVEGPLLDTGTAFGNPASEMVRDHLARWIVDSKTTHRFLIAPLGLNNYTVNYRD